MLPSSFLKVPIDSGTFGNFDGNDFDNTDDGAVYNNDNYCDYFDNENLDNDGDNGDDGDDDGEDDDDNDDDR